MDRIEEELFLFVTCRYSLCMDIQDFCELQEEVIDEFPEINLKRYPSSMIGEFLRNVYFALHSCAEGTLFREGFPRIALCLSSIKDYERDGCTSSEILGVPLEMLEAIERNGIVNRLNNVRSREEMCNIYKNRHNLFKKEGLPNYYQFRYLESYATFSHVYDEYGYVDYLPTPFDIKMYHRLKECDNSKTYNDYRKYYNLSILLKDVIKYTGIPKVDELEQTIEHMLLIRGYINEVDNLDFGIEIHSDIDKYYYSDGTYTAFVPTTVMEVLDEGFTMHNCLQDYVLELAYGETHVVFVRREGIKGSYMDIEVDNDGFILQARKKFNASPNDEDEDFVRKYAEEKGFVLTSAVFDGIDIPIDEDEITELDDFDELEVVDFDHYIEHITDLNY